MSYTKTYKRNLSTGRYRRAERVWPAALIGGWLLLAGMSCPALESDRQQPINVSADSSELDARTGFTRIVGSVVIRQGTLEVNADDAEVYVESGRVTRVLLNGEPATWRQQMESLEWMDARAAQIDYQVNDATIQLTGDALVNHPQGQITGDKLTYDLDAEKLRGDSSNGGRVTIRLEPEVIESNAPEVMDDVLEQVTTPAGDGEQEPTADQTGDEADDDPSGEADSGEDESASEASNNGQTADQ